MADSPKTMVMAEYCMVCDNYERHQEECQWCEYEIGMVHPSRFQPTLIGASEILLGTNTPRDTKYEELAIEIGQLVDEKNQAYGDSVGTSAEAFKLLYPDGIKPEQYSDALLQIRMWDKMKRIATKKDAFGESPYRDITGYGLIGALKDEKR